MSQSEELFYLGQPVYRIVGDYNYALPEPLKVSKGTVIIIEPHRWSDSKNSGETFHNNIAQPQSFNNIARPQTRYYGNSEWSRCEKWDITSNFWFYSTPEQAIKAFQDYWLKNLEKAQHELKNNQDIYIHLLKKESISVES